MSLTIQRWRRTMDNLELLTRYLEAKTVLTSAKKLEMDLRLEVLENLFPSGSLGTINAELGPFKVKGVFKNNITIDADAWFDYEDQMTDAERCCVKIKPSIIAANYKLLENHEVSGLLDDIITVKPATPALTLELEE
jgi:hypothetical protein